MVEKELYTIPLSLEDSITHIKTIIVKKEHELANLIKEREAIKEEQNRLAEISKLLKEQTTLLKKVYERITENDA